jgi:hypothetical protein
VVEFVYTGRSLHWYIYMNGAHVSRYTAFGSFWLRSNIVAALWRCARASEQFQPPVHSLADAEPLSCHSPSATPE